jgi:hypothetical protein
MKRNLQGLYEVSKFVVATGHLIEATGATREEARENLKKAVEEYRKNPGLVVAGTFASPGHEKEDANGSISIERNPDRQGVAWCRPEILDAVRANEVERQERKAK